MVRSGISFAAIVPCVAAPRAAPSPPTVLSRQNFKLVAGEDNLSSYESSPGQTRYFCKSCGSPMLSRNTARPGQVRVRLGTITSDITERPLAHIFTSSKANWETLCGDLPCYDDYEL